MKLKELTDSQRKVLSDLIQMKSPDWMDPEVKEETHKNWYTNQARLENQEDDWYIRKVLTDILGIVGMDNYNLTMEQTKWKTITGYVDVNKFLFWWKAGQIISTSTAQDPKQLTQANFVTAAEHACNQWNNEWIDTGHFNLEIWSKLNSSNRFVLACLDVEHRLWGVVGFQLGVVPLGIKGGDPDTTPKPITLSDGSKYDPSGKLLSTISSETGKTVEEIVNLFCQHKWLGTFGTMMDEKKQSEYFRKKNKNSPKTKLQLAHSYKSEMNDIVKSTSSIKNHNDKSTYNTLHPFFEHKYTDSKLYDLKSYEHSLLIRRHVIDGYDYVESSTAASLDWIKTCNEIPTNEQNKNVDDCLDFLFDLSKSIDTELSNNKIQDILRMTELLKIKKKYISCLNTFGKALMVFYKEKSYDDSGEQTKFGWQLNSNTKVTEHNKRWDILWNEFLQGLKDNDHLKSIGIVDIPVTLPRTYDSKAQDKNLKEHNNKDVDDRILTVVDSKHGGHIIPEFLLARLSEEERKEIFTEETERLSSRGYKPITDFATNLRTMSSRHNLLMRHLRLSDYLDILDNVVDKTDDDEIKEMVKKELEKDYYVEMSKRDIVQL
jgi:hypothetical protein